MPHVQLMSRRGCCLCDAAKKVVAAAAADGLCSWETVDVDTDKALLLRYGHDVPVLLMNGEERFRHRIEAADLRAALRLELPAEQEVGAC